MSLSSHDQKLIERIFDKARDVSVMSQLLETVPDTSASDFDDADLREVWSKLEAIHEVAVKTSFDFCQKLYERESGWV